MNLFDVSGKRAIVTGGRRGIGRAFALALKENGAKVAVIAKSSDKGDLPSEIKYTSADLTMPNIAMNVIENLAYELGGLDILVNAAGMQVLEPAIDKSELIWNNEIALMLTTPFFLSQVAATFMIPFRWGRIINVCSISSFTGNRNAVAYAAAKHGLVGMTKTLSNEWAQYGITVNGIAPGFIETDMLKSLTDDAEHTKQIVGRIPIGRLGKPEDLVGALLFLASDASAYVTGMVIIVDGGWLAR